MKKVLSKGFTTVEVLIVTVVSGVLFGLVFAFFWEYWQYAERAQADIDTLTSRLDTGDYIRERVGTTSGLVIQNGIADPNANTPQSAGSSYWRIIHPEPITISVSTSEDQPILYFKRFSQNSSGDFIMNGTNPYEDEHIIYLNSQGELRVRDLANLSAAGNALQTSCPPSIASPTCPADRLLLTDVESIETRYFSRSGNIIDYTPCGNDPCIDPDTGFPVYGPDFPAAQVLDYKISLAKTPFTQSSETTKSITVIRVALRNI